MVDACDYAIKPASEKDVPAIYALICELAEYENLLDSVLATEQDIHNALFGEHPAAECLMAEINGQPIGVAVFYTTFSTFVGKPGMYLEDIYVKPEMRGRGIGRALLRRLAQIAKQRNYGRIEWAVLNWNEPAIRFYQSIGAEPLSEWTTYRMIGDAVDQLESLKD